VRVLSIIVALFFASTQHLMASQQRRCNNKDDVLFLLQKAKTMTSLADGWRLAQKEEQDFV